MIVLGIDPGLATTGFGVIKVDYNRKNLDSDFELIDFGCMVTDKNHIEGDRLKSLHKDTGALLKKYSPDVLTIERLFFFKNAKTIISVGQARGVVILSAAEAGIPVLEYAPLQVKAQIVGYGRAKKKEVEVKVKEILNKRVLKLRKEDKVKDGHHLDDAVDALAVAICHTFMVSQDHVSKK